PTEELGAVARKLLDLVDERQIEALAEFDDLALLLLDLGFGDVERRGDARQLLAQCSKLRVQLVDPSESIPADLLFGGKPQLGSIGALAKLAQSDIASLDLLLGKQCALLLGSEAGFEFSGAIAQRSQFVRRLLLRQRRYLSLEISSGTLEGVEITPQTFDLAQLQLDLLLVGAD